MLERLIYVSTAEPGLTLPDVRDIVARALMNNRRVDVTGMLLFMRPEIVQVLEGRNEVLDRLLAAISADRRHAGLRLIDRRAVNTRRFDRWSMGLIVTDAMTQAVQQMKAGELSVEAVMDAMLSDADLL